MISPTRRLTMLLVALLVLMTAGLLPIKAGAQVSATAPVNASSNTTALGSVAFDRAESSLEFTQNQLNSDTITDAKLVELRLSAQEIAGNVLGEAVKFGPRLNEINLRLQQLGDAPAEGEPAEAEVIAQERASLLEEKSMLNQSIAQAESVSIRAANLVEQIAQVRRDLFAARLTEQVDLRENLDAETLQDFYNERRDLSLRTKSWARSLTTFKYTSFLWALGWLLAFALALVMFFSRWLKNILARSEDAGTPSYFTRLFSALLSTLIPSIALGIFLAGWVLIFSSFDIWRSDIRQIAIVLFQVIWVIFFIRWLSKAVFGPSNSQLRLFDVHQKATRSIIGIAIFVAVVSGLDFGLATISEILASPVSLSVSRSFVAAILVGLALIVSAFLKPFHDENGLEKPWPVWLKRSLILAGLLPILAALLGYVSLARFATQQIVITGGILLTMYIGYLSASAMTSDKGLTDSIIGQRLGRKFNLDQQGLDRLSVIASLATYVVVTFIGLPLILLQWGYQPEELRIAIVQLLNGFTIGSVTISLTAIGLGIVAFAIGMWVTRRFQNWLDGSVLTKSQMDRGVRTSIRTAIGYVGIALAGLIGVTVAGFDLSSLALVAGALSLGIGFGLQNIVSNFVSGLILLAERPFKEGDWIEAGSVSGFVKKVSVRATEIETFHRQTILLPNSELINSAVGNWTHRNMLARVDIMVGVGYGSDVVQVQEVLRQIADDHPQVLRNPEPFVLFKDFGASSLDFELRLFLPDLFQQAAVQTEIRTSIFQRFKELNIEIPFPQQDVHLKMGDIPEEKAEQLIARKVSKNRKTPDPDD